MAPMKAMKAMKSMKTSKAMTKGALIKAQRLRWAARKTRKTARGKVDAAEMSVKLALVHRTEAARQTASTHLKQAKMYLASHTRATGAGTKELARRVKEARGQFHCCLSKGQRPKKVTIQASVSKSEKRVSDAEAAGKKAGRSIPCDADTLMQAQQHEMQVKLSKMLENSKLADKQLTASVIFKALLAANGSVKEATRSLLGGNYTQNEDADQAAKALVEKRRASYQSHGEGA